MEQLVIIRYSDASTNSGIVCALKIKKYDSDFEGVLDKIWDSYVDEFDAYEKYEIEEVVSAKDYVLQEIEKAGYKYTLVEFKEFEF